MKHRLVAVFYILIMSFIISFNSPVVYAQEDAYIYTGSGTKEDPYLITSTDDLLHLQVDVNGGNSYSGFYFLQTVDIDLEGIEWIPIGVYGGGNYFKGTYDGGGHVIKNLVTITEGNNGFFGMLMGTVVNLGIDSGYISGACCGGITSHGSGCVIINCYNRATVDAYGRSGGIGDNLGKSTVINCWSDADLIGKATGGIVSYTAGLISHCYSTYDLVVKDTFSGEIIESEVFNDNYQTIVKNLNGNLFSIISSRDYDYISELFRWTLAEDGICGYGNKISYGLYIIANINKVVSMVEGIDFISYVFLLLFLPLTFMIYKLVGHSALRQNIVLLVASILFYASYNILYIPILAVCIFISWGGVRVGSRFRDEGNSKTAKRILILALCANVSILILFKYITFVFTVFAARFTLDINLPNILLPVGLSFYVFQSSSYILDYYYQKIEPESCLVNYALFVCFFPTIVSGPIQKSKDFLPKIREEKSVTFDLNFIPALFMFLWGMFVKLLLADRLNILTTVIFDDYTNYSGWVLVVGAIAYTIQIYADFSSYSTMAIAVALLFGYELQPNFRQPYFATSIVDFWRRWHISLTSWFREYLYIPLGGNRKGTFRKYINIMIVFLVSGVWHGAGLHYVVWGGLHAIFQIVSLSTVRYRERLCGFLHINRNCLSYRIWQSVCVFLLSAFAWIFFRSASLTVAVGFILNMLKLNNFWIFFDSTLNSIGWTVSDWYIAAFAILLLIIVSLFKEKGYTVQYFMSQNLIAKYACFLVILLLIVIYGVYGADYEASSFIYAGF